MGRFWEGPDREAAGSARVLVVDDSRVVRAAVKGYLRAQGYTVDEAGDGRSALGLIEAGRYDVVVSDLAMPGLDGLGLLEALRKRPDRPETILLTGSPGAEPARRALVLGAHACLDKPAAGPDAVAQAVARAVECKRLRDVNGHLRRQLEAVGRTDPLTGLPNLRAFEEALAGETARARRYGLPLSLALMDLDRLAQINRVFGRAAGDEAVKHFSRLARGGLKNTDLLHHLGGGGFAALLPHTPLSGAETAARRLLGVAAEAPVVVGGQVVRFTCSAGVAALDDAGTAEALVARADAALDDAKRCGGGQVRGLAPRAPAPQQSAARPRAREIPLDN
jgi:diguanylate cyclase (GGDEF)-like protein